LDGLLLTPRVGTGLLGLLLTPPLRTRLLRRRLLAPRLGGLLLTPRLSTRLLRRRLLAPRLGGLLRGGPGVRGAGRMGLGGARLGRDHAGHGLGVLRPPASVPPPDLAGIPWIVVPARGRVALGHVRHLSSICHTA
jgi:hypothetical protein